MFRNNIPNCSEASASHYHGYETGNAITDAAQALFLTEISDGTKESAFGCQSRHKSRDVIPQITLQREELSAACCRPHSRRGGDVCDGMFRSTSREVHVMSLDLYWKPFSLGRIQAIRAGDEKFGWLLWKIGHGKTLFVFGIENPATKDFVYVSVKGEGHLVLMQGKNPEVLSESEIESDPRVFQHYYSNATNKKLLRSRKNRELFVNMKDKRLFAEKSSEMHATSWEIQIASQRKML